MSFNRIYSSLACVPFKTINIHIASSSMLVGKFIGTICQYNLIPNIGSAFNVICICHYSPIPVRLLPTRESSLNKMRTITIIFYIAPISLYLLAATLPAPSSYLFGLENMHFRHRLAQGFF